MSGGRAETMGDAIAIIGMSGRFPQSESVERFWDNLCQGVECISVFTPEELEEQGIPAQEHGHEDYVAARGILGDIASFDAGLFGYTPREAELIDPQQRLFLECAWEAMESAGYSSGKFPGAIGCFGGVGLNTYLLNNVAPNRHIVDAVGVYQTMISNDKDYLVTRTAYKLGLTGPAVTIQTACSTSLVAVHHACQALLSYQCDLALAGGAAVWSPHKAGYQYYQGGILSPDGHCRAFDADASGTVVGTGVGVVTLRRYEEAVRDGDEIVAVILGSAVNNDGSDKIGFTAPSVNGQAKVIAEALAVASVAPEAIGYVEAHGTGTPLGDPIEMAALNKVFCERPYAPGSCAIGSVKANIGHADAAAGVASLIKTALIVKHGLIPPSINYRSPNPKIDFAASPFFVNTTCRPWFSNGVPRRAGVSSFGIGGTNAHAVLQEPPAQRPSGPARGQELLCLSAKTESALNGTMSRLKAFLERGPATPLADVAFTLHRGRTDFEHRCALVCADSADAAAALDADSPRIMRSMVGRDRPSVVFMCTGQGSQFAGMGRRLYESEDGFKSAFDECARLLQPVLGADLRRVVLSGEEGSGQLDRTDLAQPALFALEYGIAQLWRSWGVRPESLVGHSIGEYVAACLAGVMSLEQACEMVAIRGRLMQRAPAGAMTGVKASVAVASAFAWEGVSLAVDNGPEATVYAGSFGAIEHFEQRLAREGIGFSRLRTSHAFHSPLMDSVLDEFAQAVSRFAFEKPAVPYMSNVTGTWITAEQAVDPGYYVKHLRSPVLFGPSMDVLLQSANLLLCEIGPGRVLGSLAMKHPRKGSGHRIVASLPHPDERAHEQVGILRALGKLWMSGIDVDWAGFYGRQTRNRLELPTYPFERKRFWIEAHGVPGIGTLSNASSVGAANGAGEASSDTGQTASTVRDGPLDETRQAIAGIWREVLGVEAVGPHDSLFELGGQSLQAVQIATKISQHFSIDLTVGKLVELPTISLLADYIGGSRAPGAPVAAAAPAAKQPERARGDLEAILRDHPFVEIEQRPLLQLVATEKVAKVDAAAFDYIPLQLLQFSGLDRETFIDTWCNNLPVLQGIWEVPLGRIAYIVLPRLSADLYNDKQDAVRVVVEALELAASIGAKAVSLTGIIPSATDYGRAVAAAVQGRSGLPRVTTGHGTTTASVLLSIKGILERGRRDPRQERMAFVGLGSIGQATLRLMLRALPHPRELLLCDIYGKRHDLERLRDEVIQSGYQGRVAIAESRASLPDEVYGSSFIFGATNVPNILDIGRVASGTLIVDDSAPHCYSPAKAIERFERDRDILFTEGGMLASDHAVRDLTYIPTFAARGLAREQIKLFLRRDAHEFWGCMFSSLLTARFDDLEPTFGMVGPDITKLHLDRLQHLGMRPASLHCDRYQLPGQYIEEFVSRHAHAQQVLS